ncbi:MAG: copper chaperone PCu(A)C [Paracoccaceae bacterium]
MKRIFILISLLLISFIAILLTNQQTNTISLLGGSAVQSPQNNQMFMVSLKIENTGAPDRLISAASPSAHNVSITNSGHEGSAIIIPKDGTGILAMDGAHIMLMTKPDTFTHGTFIPLNLTFENAGSVTIRLQNTGAAVITHGRSNSASETPAPTLELSWEDVPTKDGAKLRLETNNFTFSRADDDAAHVPNEGHAHVYLNGLKLGRLYSDTYQIGALSPGNYTLSVALNSNDHYPYVNDSGPVMGDLVFEIPD